MKIGVTGGLSSMISICFLCFSSCQLQKSTIQYLSAADFTVAHASYENIKSFGDTLFLVNADSNQDQYFYQRYQTGVCFDNQCRPLDITLYWHITGRYLGFQLPEGEFLSKTDHEPFRKEEYEQLHSLLMDPDLPFDEIEYHELMDQQAGTTESVDAVSGATSKKVEGIIVKGAVYTTYKMWRLVHGPSMQFIQGYTRANLTNDLLLAILNSANREDVIWGLEQIDDEITYTENVGDKLGELILSDDFHVAYTTVHAIKDEYLKEEAVQEMLSETYGKIDQGGIKQIIIQKFIQAPALSQKTIANLTNGLDDADPKSISDILKLLGRHDVRDEATMQIVNKLLNHENQYVVSLAIKFLDSKD